MKKTIQLLTLALLSAPLAAVAGSCGGCGHSHSDKAEKAEKADIVGTAIAAGQFNTLVAAVQAAGLVETLQGEGPFTVFAPTDEAFAALPEGTVENLLKPENKDQLIAVLTYHVVSGKVKSSQVKSGEVGTVNGATATVEVSDGGVTIEGANVVAVDVYASNGVIHVIDQVILPPM